MQPYCKKKIADTYSGAGTARVAHAELLLVLVGVLPAMPGISIWNWHSEIAKTHTNTENLPIKTK